MSELSLGLSRFARVGPRAAVRLRWWVPVVGGLVFFVLWTVAEAGRSPHGVKELFFLGWAVMIALVGFAPYVSLVIAAAAPVVMFVFGSVLLGLDWPGGVSLSTTWPTWLAVPMVVAYVGAVSRKRALHATALVAGFISSCGFAVIMEQSGWVAWTGGVSGDGVRVALNLAAALFSGVVIAWLIGIGLAALWRVQVVSGRLETTVAKLDETDLELKLAHDRGRISRDIHDSLAHSLAIIVAQAEGAAAIHELKPEAAPESLGNIATVARHALGEVRRLVERINDDEDVSEHTSRLEHIPALIDDIRSVGVDAQLRLLGDPGDPGDLALSKQVAVYRIVQESLTNALKHGGRGTAATVTLDAQGTGLAVLIVSKSGGGEPLVQAGGRGIGIAGMKERARLVGGWLTAVPSDDETFVVTAFIPPDVVASGAETEADGQPRDGASADLVDASSETAPLEIEGARD